MNRTLHLEADFGSGVGVGHVMRCLALAEEWQRNEGATTLKTPSPLTTHLEQRALQVGATVVDDYPAVSADWIVLDSYRANVERQRELSTKSKLLVIDDHRHQQEYAAEMVLDQNVDARDHGYDSSSIECLLGPSFALLRDEFRRARSTPKHTAEVRRILITLGGDPSPALVNEIRTVVAQVAPKAAVDVADGARADMVDLMASADLAVSAAGTTTLELCCMGVPSLLIPIASNQLPVANALGRHGAAMSSSLANLEVDLRSVVTDALLRSQLSNRAFELVDGRGASRVVASMRSRSLTVRSAVSDDARLLFDWANELDTRSQSFNMAPIAWDDHVHWLADSLLNPRRALGVVSDTDKPIGQVRVDLIEDGAVIGVSIDHELRGTGLGPAVLRAGTRWARQRLNWSGSLDAWIKPSNVASEHTFSLAGFTFAGRGSQSGFEALRYRDIGDG